MIKSMTGYGVGTTGRGNNRAEITVRSVNSRYLEISFRGIYLDPKLESEIINIIESNLERGNIVVTIENKNFGNDNIVFNRQRFETIKNILKNIHVIYGQRLDLSDIISTNDLLLKEENRSNDKNIINAVKKALKQLTVMSEIEGKNIYLDLVERIELLNELISEIEIISKNYQEEKHANLKNKISELLGTFNLDDARLIQEVAYYVERVEINEEVVRVKSHLNQLKSFLDGTGQVGKRLNFLLQEVSREVNTIGSKTPLPSITIKIVEMKSEIEKIREQVQNIQ